MNAKHGPKKSTYTNLERSGGVNDSNIRFGKSAAGIVKYDKARVMASLSFAGSDPKNITVWSLIVVQLNI
jgi:hypothetical protein